MNSRSSSTGTTSSSKKQRTRKQPQQPQDEQPSAGARGSGADVQGEGNYDATRRYDRSTREFVQSGQVDDAARAAQPRDEREAEELRRAEDVGRSHARDDANDRMDDSDEESRERARPPRG